MNAATEAAFAGHLKHFPGDLAHHKVNCMTMVYAAQTQPGDNLDIYIWEDRLMKRRVHCQIEKSGQLVYNTAIDFFEDRILESSHKESKM